MSAYYNNNRSRPDNWGGRSSQRGGDARRSNIPAETKPEKLPPDYVEEAERVMRSLWNEKGKFEISTSKIRNFLSMITELYNVENLRREQELHPDSISRLMLVRMRMVYEYGRNESGVRQFVQKAKLLEYLKGIDSREELICFSHYMEALVAYHRYLGGSEG